jgi:predicted dehydrogenase
LSTRTILRRRFLQHAAGIAAAPYFVTTVRGEDATTAKNERPVIGCIGAGGRWGGIVGGAMRYADVVAVADVDRNRADKAKARVGENATVYGDYRKLLDRQDVEAVVVATPDHWHTKICVEAMQAGKDIYCEKPLTLTIEEGRLLRKVLEQTGRIVQVGTQQRSGRQFLQAVAMVHAGRIGKLQKVQCAIGGAPSSGPLETEPPPDHLNWEMWQGQAPRADYTPRRCHGEFRWWYEYSGGKMTDWGAHHVDIATWAMGGHQAGAGPTRISGTAKYPVEFNDGHPTARDRYNTAVEFNVKCQFASGVELTIRHDTDNGILLEGTEGRIFVNRGKIAGEPVDALKDDPLPADALTQLYKGKLPRDHMGNFFDCVKDRSQPVSDVASHLRALDTCHLANICIRLGRPIQWDPQREAILGDEQAASFVSRQPREGYEIRV